MSMETAYAAVQVLVEKFSAHEAAYMSADFGETSVRQEFLDDLLTAFGWDVAGKLHPNPFEREVRVERSVNMGAAKKRADYALFTAPNFRDVRLYIEAKRPTSQLATQDNYFQAARYGWSSGLPLSVLTDFRELHIIDCRSKPDIETVLTAAKSPYRYHYSEFSNKEKFSELYWLISREAVGAGSLEKRADELPKKRGKAFQKGLFKGGYQKIDDAFLEDLDEMREILAKSFKATNPGFDGEVLTEVTQRVLDRLVFLRFLEDKLIETHEKVASFGDKGSVWADFLISCQKLDTRYNGVVFKPHRLIDSHKLKADDDMFGEICERLADVNSPYDFNVIPIHILGSIYERFLGKIIETTDKQAVLIEKPEVRKAGGVYYTPEYIVRFIADQTVGKKIAGKTPSEIAEMRFADISCGSGSFLLGVFDLLLRYHTLWYNKRPKREHPKLLKAECAVNEDGTLSLTLKKRREILLNNIFGVDLDNQATEVAQLSLFLKLLEDETTATARNYQLEMGAALLPSLAQNIVCGNSLVGTDILDDEKDLFENEDKARRKLNPMDFEYAFRDIFKKKGGFDVIIGNPPYVRPHKMLPMVKKYFWDTLATFRAKSDLYSCFMEKGVDLLRPDGGVLSFIVPHTWVSLESFESIRKKLVEETIVSSLTRLPKKVFRDATVEACIFQIQRADSQHIEKNIIEVNKLSSDGHVSQVKTYAQADIACSHKHNFQLYSGSHSHELLQRLTANGVILERVVSFAYGFKTADDDQFLSAIKLNDEYKAFIRSSAVKRYLNDEPSEYVWYRPDLMVANKATARPGEVGRFESEKIIVSRMGKRLYGSYDPGGLYVKDAMLLLPKNGLAVSLKVILALLNSRLLGFLYREFFVTIDVLKNALLGLPLPADVLLKDSPELVKLDKLASQLIAATNHKEKASTDKDLEFYSHRCSQLDVQIDDMVYKLYGLTEDEIKIVENQ